MAATGAPNFASKGKMRFYMSPDIKFWLVHFEACFLVPSILFAFATIFKYLRITFQITRRKDAETFFSLYMLIIHFHICGMELVFGINQQFQHGFSRKEIDVLYLDLS
jgi:hypothetical protein